MKNMFEIYHAFFPRKYNNFKGITPIYIIAILIVDFYFLPTYIDILSVGLILAAEYIYSCTKLNGILNRRNSQNDYIKSSPNGYEVIKKAVYTDSIIRLIIIFILSTALSLANNRQLLIMDIISLTLVLVGIGELTTFISYYIVRAPKLITLHIVTIVLTFLYVYMYMYFKPLDQALFFTLFGACAILFKYIILHRYAKLIYQ